MAGTTVNFKNHCVLCLNPEDPLQMHYILQTNPGNLHSFQPVVQYLTGTDPTISATQQTQDKELPVIKNLPTLCIRCYDLSVEIYGLHTKLQEFQKLIQNKVDNVREIVLKSSESPNRRLFLERLKLLGMTNKAVEQTLGFVSKFHGKIIDQVNKPVKFPLHAPPPFHFTNGPPLDPKQVSVMTYAASFLECDMNSSSKAEGSVVIVPGISEDIKFENEDAEEVEIDKTDFSEQNFTTSTATQKPLVLRPTTVKAKKLDTDPKTVSNSTSSESRRSRQRKQSLVTKEVSVSLAAEPEPVREARTEKVEENSELSKPEEKEEEKLTKTKRIVRIRPPEAGYPCDFCNCFFQPKELQGHMKAHLGGTEGHSCPSCLRVFLSRSRLHEHWEKRSCGDLLRQENDNQLPDKLICKLCSVEDKEPKIFANINAFRVHVLGQHEGAHLPPVEKKHGCNLCPAKYRTEYGLDFHRIVHAHRKRRYVKT